MRKFLIIIVKTLLGIISVIISLCLIIIAVFFILNDTYRFSPIARDFLNKNIDGEIYFDSLKLHFRDFPVIGVSIVNGMLIADTDLFPNDTLCQVKKLHASIDPFMIMKDNLIYIPEAYIDQGKAHVILNEHGRPDWAIWHFIKKKKNVEGEKEKTKKTKGPIKLNIQHVYLTNSPVFYYKNHHTGLELSAGAENLYLNGRIAIDYKKINADTLVFNNLYYTMYNPKSGLKIDVDKSSINLTRQDDDEWNLCNLFLEIGVNEFDIKYKPLIVDSEVKVNAKLDLKKTFSAIKNCKLLFSVNNNHLEFLGDVAKIDSGFNTNVDIGLVSQNIKKLISNVPAIRNLLPEEFDFNLAVMLNTHIEGDYKPLLDQFPDITGQIKIKNSYLDYKNYPQINNLNFTSKFRLDLNKPSYFNLNISNVDFKVLNSFLQYKGVIQGDMKNPSIKGYLNSDLYLEDINKFGLIKGYSFRGDVRTNLFVNIPRINQIKDIKSYSFNGKLKLTGVEADKNNIQLFNLKNGYIEFENKPEENFRSHIDLQHIHSEFDSIYINMDSLFTSIRIPDINDSLSCLSIDAHNVQIHKGEDTIKALNILTDLVTTIKKDTIEDDSIYFHAIIQKVGIDFDSIKILSENAAFSIESTFDLRNRDNKDTVSTFKRIIEEGNLFGGLIVKNTEILVPQYSLPNHIENLTMIINDDLIALKELKLISGSSNFNISGKAYDWRESILNKDTLTANLDIQSDSLNITQVLAAFSPGEKNETENKNGESKDYNENISTTTPGLIQIPKSFNMMINLDAKNLIYDKAEVNSVKGNLLFSNGAFFMHDITLKSGLGNIELSATYAPYSKLQGYTGLNLNIDNLNVEKVIELDDRIIKILPMLSTLQGFVSCNLNLTLELDSMYSPYPGSINATTTIKGNDLSVEKNKVLPKWVGKLLLGKRKRIEIDSISVDVDMYNDVLNIYPFIANIDQYKFYILGYQDVDDSFFYHVSLLKWFLPFKLGFNIYGVPDHMHLRLAKAKIINPDMPAKVISNKNGDVIRPLRINQILQQESQRQQNIYKDFSNQYYNIINQDSLRYSSEERDRIINQLNKTLNETSK